MMSPLLKAILKFCTRNHLLIITRSYHGLSLFAMVRLIGDQTLKCSVRLAKFLMNVEDCHKLFSMYYLQTIITLFTNHRKYSRSV